MKMTKLERPNINDRPQGTVVSWSEETPNQVKVIVWIGYAPKTGRYTATKVHFSVNEEAKTLTLSSVSVKYGLRPHPIWIECETDLQSHVSDRIKRSARAFIAKEKGSTYWRVIL